MTNLPRWLTLIGMGEDGLEGLSSAAKTLLSQAELVVGGARHLALAGPLACQTLAWPSPLSDAFATIAARRGRPVVVLATGDPFFYGIGSVLAQQFMPEEMLCLPGASAFGLAAARLGWALQDCAMLSLHGRDLALVVPRLQPGAKILALSWDGTTPGQLAALLRARGMSSARITVLEALGGPRERVTARTAGAMAAVPFDALNLVALEIFAEPGARFIPLASGVPDEWFETDGQITKREIRAMTLSALAPLAGQLLWDVGAGSGSIGIEWMLRDVSCRAIAVEPLAERAARIARNAISFGVPGLRIVQGEAPVALAGLPRPDAVFLGGGGSDAGVIPALWTALRPGGRLVANAVTLETQALLLQGFQAHGGDLMQVSLSRANPVGPYFGWRPAMPMMQWSVTKP